MTSGVAHNDWLIWYMDHNDYDSLIFQKYKNYIEKIGNDVTIVDVCPGPEYLMEGHSIMRTHTRLDF